MKDLRYFIRHHAFWDEDLPQTHTFFGGKTPKKLSISDEFRKDFYKAYIDYIQQNSENTLCQPNSLNAITEKAGDTLRFFVDVDLKLLHFKGGYVSIHNVLELMNDTIETFVQVLYEAFGEHYDCISAFRMLYKCHLHFPDVIVTHAQAKSICEDVNIRLAQKYPWISNKDYGIIDTSVYRTGLRLLYSHKGSMGKGSDLESHIAYFGENDVPYGHYYRIAKIDEGELKWYDDPITLDGFMLTSIQCNSATNTPMEFLDSYRVISPVKKSVHVATSRVTRNRVASSSHNEAEDDRMEIDEMDIEEDANEPQGTLPPKILFLVREYIDKVIGDMGCDSTILEMKINQYGSILAVLAPQVCPFICRMHKRTMEKNVSATYVVLNAFECTLRCFDDKCTDVITLNYPDDDLARELRHHTKHYVLKRSLYKQTNETVAEYIFSLLHDSHATSSVGANYIYYHYVPKEHRWVQQENILLTIMSESGIVQRSYNQYIKEVMDDAGIPANDKKKLKGLWLELETQLQTTAFVRAGVLPILTRKLEDYWMKIIKRIRKGKMVSFQSILDDNPKLMGFTNGVWDFHNNVFRDGRPTDFISMSTNLKYSPFDEIPSSVKTEMFHFLRTIYPKEEHLDYVITEIASCLNGTPNQQRFFLMTGRGANGKSTLVRLLNLSFGDYAGEVNITLFTKPRPPANAPCPELIAIKGQRFVSCSEPNAREPFNLGTIKWLTGGDRVTAAQKFEKNQSFYLQCTFFSLINDIPPINATINDNGIWRRMKPVEHYSRFVDDPDPNNPFEFKTDDMINDKMESWREAFISYLIHVFLMKKVCKVPQEFLDLFHKLQGDNDIYLRFVQECITKDGDFRESMAVFQAFNAWAKAMNISRNKFLVYDHFEKHMKILIGQMVEGDEGRLGWNVSIKSLPTVEY